MLEVIAACNAFIPIPVRGKEKLRQCTAKPQRSALYLKGIGFNFIPLCCCLFRISAWLGMQVHIRGCLLYTELISHKIQFLTSCWHFPSMARYRAESNKAEMSGSEGAMKSLNSETFFGGGKEISLSSYAVFCSSTCTTLILSDQKPSGIGPNK